MSAPYDPVSTKDVKAGPKPHPPVSHLVEPMTRKLPHLPTWEERLGFRSFYLAVNSRTTALSVPPKTPEGFNRGSHQGRQKRRILSVLRKEERGRCGCVGEGGEEVDGEVVIYDNGEGVARANLEGNL